MRRGPGPGLARSGRALDRVRDIRGRTLVQRAGRRAVKRGWDMPYRPAISRRLARASKILCVIGTFMDQRLVRGGDGRSVR